MKNIIRWVSAENIPIPTNPKSDIVSCMLTVEHPDDPFDPGKPWRFVKHNAWWDLENKAWIIDGMPLEENLTVIAWSEPIYPYTS